jgi:hypothetical protein
MYIVGILFSNFAGHEMSGNSLPPDFKEDCKNNTLGALECFIFFL